MQNLFSVQDKVVVVTGGSRGIGEMIAAGYLANGAKVYITSRKADVCNATAGRLMETYGGECVSIPADMATLAGIEGFVSELCSKETHLDVLVNNAGVAWGAPLEDFPEVGWDKVMDTNVKGVFLTQKLLPLLEQNAEHGSPAHVINVGSIDGIKTPIFDNFSYGPSKAAVLPDPRSGHTLDQTPHYCERHCAGAFPTYMLSAGVGGGGDTENTDWDAWARATHADA